MAVGAITATMKTRRRGILDPKITTVVLAPSEQTVSLHRGLLCQKSEYFATAYKTDFKEARENTFRLQDVSKQTLETFSVWLYSGKLFLGPLEYENGELHAEEDESDSDESDESDEEENNEVSDDDEDEDGNDMDWEEMDTDDDDDDDEENDDDDSTSDDDEEFPAENTEARALRHVGGTVAEQLDIYQLEAMVQISKNRHVKNCEEWLPKWKALLERKRAEAEAVEDDEVEDDEGEGDIDVYDELADLYIFADRFDVPELRTCVEHHISLEYERQISLNGGHPLPSYQTTAKMYNNLPDSSRLRRWLRTAYSMVWMPLRDSAEEASERDLLPKEFLMEVMMLKSEHVFWTSSSTKFESGGARELRDILTDPEDSDGDVDKGDQEML